MTERTWTIELLREQFAHAVALFEGLNVSAGETEEIEWTITRYRCLQSAALCLSFDAYQSGRGVLALNRLRGEIHRELQRAKAMLLLAAA